MGRKRTDKKNKGLPERWAFKNGAYYYIVPKDQKDKWDGKSWFRLGKNKAEAYSEWARRIEKEFKKRTVADLLERYAAEIVPTKGIRTQSANILYIKSLNAVFGHKFIEEIKPSLIHTYIDKRKIKKKDKDGKVRGGLSIAKREIAMFSDAFTHAVMWGYLDAHPFKGEIITKGEKPRTRYIDDWEFDEFMSLQPRRKKDTVLVIQAYCYLKFLTGLRQQDILMLTFDSLKEDGIHITPLKTEEKTGEAIIIEWTSALEEAIDICIAVRPNQNSEYIVCRRDGGSYYDPLSEHAGSGWRSIFKRYMKRALQETNLKDKFTEHDIRAKTASDADDDKHAQKLLAHANIETTKRVYRRKPTRVKPIK